MNDNNAIISLRNTAAEVLAVAMSEIYPNINIISGGSTDTGFFYDFEFNNEISQLELKTIEEKMYLMVNDESEIKTLQMIPSNAAAYIKHLGCKSKGLINKLEEAEDNIVSVIQINNYINIIEEDALILKNTKDLKNFKLYKSELIESNGKKIRIFGALFEYFKDLKKYLKVQKKYFEQNHLTYGKDLNLFFPLDGKYSKYFIWKERGLALKNIISSSLASLLEKEYFNKIELPDNQDVRSLKTNEIASANIKNIIESSSLKKDLPFYFYEEKKVETSVNDLHFGLYRADKKNIINEYIVCSEADLLKELISSLKFILKILKIYGFNGYNVVYRFLAKKSKLHHTQNANDVSLLEEALKQSDISYSSLESIGGTLKPSIDFFLEDGQGFFHKGPYLSVDPLFVVRKKAFCITRSTLGVIDDFIASFLEKEKGELCFEVNPEHVRIICLDSCFDYALKIKDICESKNIRSYIDIATDPINTRIHIAVKEKVSFIVVVGEKEKIHSSITMRNTKESKTEQMSIDSFVEKLEYILKGKLQDI